MKNELLQADVYNTEAHVWKLLTTDNKTYWKFAIEGEPEILHIVKSGHEDEFFYFYEDAYELEPYLSGIKSDLKFKIEQKFNIKIK